MRSRATRESDQPVDAIVRLVTPERIEFEYPLGGPFRRFTAYLIDLALMSALVMAGFMLPSSWRWGRRREWGWHWWFTS